MADFTINIPSQILAAIIAAAVTIGLYTLTRRRERRKAREIAADEAQREYFMFLQICLEYPQLGLSVSDREREDLSPAERSQRDTGYEFLIGVLEGAFLRAEAAPHGLKQEHWEGWQPYIETYCARAGFQQFYGWTGSGLSAASGFHRYLSSSFNNFMTGMFR